MEEYGAGMIRHEGTAHKGSKGLLCLRKQKGLTAGKKSNTTTSTVTSEGSSQS